MYTAKANGFFEATFGYIATIGAGNDVQQREKSHGNKRLLYSSLCNSTTAISILEEPD